MAFPLTAPGQPRRSRPPVALALLGLALLGLALLAPGFFPVVAQAPLLPKSRLFWWGHPNQLEWSTNKNHALATAPVAVPGFPWKESVVSWNIPSNWHATVEARPILKDTPGPWYTLARWSSDPAVFPRTSVRDQADAIASVDTDILRMHDAADAIEVRLVFPRDLPRSAGAVRLGVSLLAAMATEPPAPVETNAWGRLIDLPVRSQADYPEGIHSWCSPTSLTMLLSHWGKARNLADPALDVRPVAAAVHDPGWGGTGNWSFNVGYAGQHPGLVACVARLGGVGDLERWILAGIPVAASVSYAQLKGAPLPHPGDGHLVVVSGFTPSGDVRIHDPGVARERVVRTIPRADFARAWDHSSRTTYLVWPDSIPTPRPSFGRWPSPHGAFKE